MAALLERVARGESIQITRRGVPVAKLVPADPPEKPDRRRLVEEIRHLRRGLTLGGLRIRDLIDEGRRF